MWRLDGTWERRNDELRALVWQHAGRNAQPIAAIVDSQSAKTTGKGGLVATMGPSKRHLLVDTLGTELKAVVRPADVSDRDRAVPVLAELPTHYPRLAHLWLDAGYTGQLVAWIEQTLGLTVTVVRKAAALGLVTGRSGAAAPTTCPRSLISN